jgi:hypothetical protein
VQKLRNSTQSTLIVFLSEFPDDSLIIKDGKVQWKKVSAAVGDVAHH